MLAYLLLVQRNLLEPLVLSRVGVWREHDDFVGNGERTLYHAFIGAIVDLGGESSICILNLINFLFEFGLHRPELRVVFLFLGIADDVPALLRFGQLWDLRA